MQQNENAKQPISTKEEERKVVEKIRKLIDSIGGNESYTGKALEGCLDMAIQNIEYDGWFSMKDSLHLEREKNATMNSQFEDQLRQEREKTEKLEKQLENLQREIQKRPNWSLDNAERAMITEMLEDKIRRIDSTLSAFMSDVMRDTICDAAWVAQKMQAWLYDRNLLYSVLRKCRNDTSASTSPLCEVLDEHTVKEFVMQVVCMFEDFMAGFGVKGWRYYFVEKKVDEAVRGSNAGNINFLADYTATEENMRIVDRIIDDTMEEFRNVQIAEKWDGEIDPATLSVLTEELKKLFTRWGLYKK